MIEHQMIKSAVRIMAMALVAALSGCGSHEPRSRQYFAAHLEEARDVVARCQHGAVRGDECTNADTALTDDKARKAFSRFLGN